MPNEPFRGLYNGKAVSLCSVDTAFDVEGNRKGGGDKARRLAGMDGSLDMSIVLLPECLAVPLRVQIMEVLN